MHSDYKKLPKDTKKTNISRLIVFAVAFFLSSCHFTPKLLDSNKYTEQMNSLLLSEDGNTVAIITPKYHYILNTPLVLKSTLESTYAGKVKAQFGEFTVDTDNDISGSVELELDLRFNRVNEIEIQSARDSGYQDGQRESLLTEFRIRGKRYKATENNVIENLYPLKRSYNIKITDASSVGSNVARVALTPLAITADGVYLASVGFAAFTVGILASALN